MSQTRASISHLKSVAEVGQQAWFDNLDREPVASSGLARLIAKDDVQRLTSNPTLFFNAVRNDASHRAALPQRGARRPRSPFEANSNRHMPICWHCLPSLV